ncbi:MAG TPA: hypothetical protein VMZ53_03570 [Kofleriaceae bacterium]|nr:hypothetical protein [Kofleriaceae bacterium]
MLKPAEALARMRSMVGLDFPYILGTGNFSGEPPRGPWDCAGAICEAFKVKRHRPGFARGPLPPAWASLADVVDDINTNSMIKDAVVRGELFTFVPFGDPLEGGDVLAYPTIRLVVDGERHEWIGHVQMIDDPKGALSGGPYSDAWVLHSHGPNGRHPAVTRNKAYAMDVHNHSWSKLGHKAHALRAVTAP